MRICHLIYDDVANPWLGGGGAIRAREIYRRLADRHDITLVTGDFPGGKRQEEAEGIHLVRVGSGRSYSMSRLSYTLTAPAQLRRLRWDVFVHEFSAFAPLRIPRRLRRQGVLFFQHFMGKHALHKHPLAGPVAWWSERRVLRAYSRILTVSPSVRQLVEEKVAGRGEVCVDCVVNGVDPRYFQSTPSESPYIIYLGRVDIHTKGIDVLVEAFAGLLGEYPELKLKLVGRGDEDQVRRLRHLADGRDLMGRAEVIVGVSESEKCDLLSRALFMCAPSRYEGWGMAAVEASASAKAVLGTRIDGLRDAVVDEETGLLVESGNPAALLAGMRRLLEDAELRRELGRKGRERARRFDWDKIAREQEQVLMRAAGE